MIRLCHHMPFRMVPAFLRFTWLFVHQTEWRRSGHFPLNSQSHLRETLYVRAQMGCCAPENLSPVCQDIKFNLMQAIPTPSHLLCPLLSVSLSPSLSHVHNVTQSMLLRNLQGVSVLSHASSSSFFYDTLTLLAK